MSLSDFNTVTYRIARFYNFFLKFRFGTESCWVTAFYTTKTQSGSNIYFLQSGSTIYLISVSRSSPDVEITSCSVILDIKDRLNIARLMFSTQFEIQ